MMEDIVGVAKAPTIRWEAACTSEPQRHKAVANEKVLNHYFDECQRL